MDNTKSVSVLDVADYILNQQNENHPITAWKLQKLIYYCQAWSLVWDEQPLFKEKILAWANGPVVQELYQLHRGLFHVKKLSQGNANNLSDDQKDTINHVLKSYGNKTAQWLSDLTHMEKPWLYARQNLKAGERGNVEIPLSLMYEYYSSIDPRHQII